MESAEKTTKATPTTKATKAMKDEPKTLIELVGAKVAHEILQTIQHPRMTHVENVYVTEEKNYHFNEGTKMYKQLPLDPIKDAKLIERGKKTLLRELPGLYISKSKVIASFEKDEVIEDADEINEAFEAVLKEEDAAETRRLKSRPNATAALMAEIITNMPKGK